MQTMKWIRIHGLEWSSLILLLWTTRVEGLADFSSKTPRRMFTTTTTAPIYKTLRKQNTTTVIVGLFA